MRNAGKPAMPVASDGFPYEQISDRDGLTKHEMIAMHVLAGIANNGAYDEYIAKKAKVAAEYANALLKELEK